MSEFKSSGEFATTWVGGLGLIQGEEIVRCKDCKHWATEARFTGMCVGKHFNPDGFCAWGERRAE